MMELPLLLHNLPRCRLAPSMRYVVNPNIERSALVIDLKIEGKYLIVPGNMGFRGAHSERQIDDARESTRRGCDRLAPPHSPTPHERLMCCRFAEGSERNDRDLIRQWIRRRT